MADKPLPPIPKKFDNTTNTIVPKPQRTKVLQYTGPKDLTAQSVYEYAMVGMTLKSIGRLYQIDPDTISKHYGHAFEQGQADMMHRPRYGMLVATEQLSYLVEREFEKLDDDPDHKPDEALLNMFHKYATSCDKYIKQDIVVEVKNDLAEVSQEQLEEKLKAFLAKK